jgi:hypothetical protein
MRKSELDILASVVEIYIDDRDADSPDSDWHNEAKALREVLSNLAGPLNPFNTNMNQQTVKLINAGGRSEAISEIPDLWHIAMKLDQDGLHKAGTAVLEVWHMAHDLKDAITYDREARITSVHRDPNRPSHWDDQPGLPVEDWQLEIANGDNRLGYLDWCDAQIDCGALEGCDETEI